MASWGEIALTISTLLSLYKVMRNIVVYLLLVVLLVPIFSSCSSKAEGPLPHSMKGYELYSWQEQGQWHFTLITGTNRNKTLEEIVSNVNPSKEDWVNIHMTGVEAIKAVLKRIPPNEWVSWQAQGFVIPPDEAKVKLALPPADIVKEIKDYVANLGFNFYVAEPQ
jgi:hypothetical protein